MDQTDIQRLNAISDALHRLLQGQLPDKLALAEHADDQIRQIGAFVNKLISSQKELYEDLLSISSGDLCADISAGSLKSLQASLRHLTRQTRRIAKDDLKQQRQELRTINDSLKQEIADKLEAREALRTSEEMFKAIALAALDAIIVMDDQGKIVYWNDAACTIFQYTKDEAMGLNLHELLTPLKTHDQFDKGFSEFAISGNGHVIGKRLELRAVRKDKLEIPVEISLSSVKIKKKWHAIGTVRDISDRKERERLEKQLSQVHKMEAIGRLASGVAHDLNNVLSGIVSYPELLLMDLPTDSPLHKPLKTIQQSGQKASAIVQDLLTLARRGGSAFEVVDLRVIIQDYLDSPECQKMLCDHQGICFKEAYDENLMNIKGVPIHLTKIVMNVIGNAIESMARGGTIEIALRNLHPHRHKEKYHKFNKGDYVQLSVQDSGGGISETDIDHIFEPFYTKKVMGLSGTGLGMAVVWGAVKDHNGHIDIKSEVGLGTQVVIHFPATTDPAPETADTRYQPDSLKGHGQTILLVDDVDNQREIGSGILSRLGYKVATAASGEQAIEYLKHHAVDLLVLDMIMSPGMDGCETYRQIRLIHPEQKAIITSGFSESDRVREVQRLGAGAYVRKPYTIEKLGRAVLAELESMISQDHSSQ